MTRRPVASGIAAVLLLSACVGSGTAPRTSPTPTPSEQRIPVATSVTCVRGRAPLGGGVVVGGTSEATPQALAVALVADATTIMSRSALSRSADARRRFRRELLATAAAHQLVVVMQLGEFQRETAKLLVDAGAAVVVAMPYGTEAESVAAGYPKETVFVMTSGTTEATAELTPAEANETASVLRGSVLCDPLMIPSPSPSPSVRSSRTTTPNASACGPAKARRPIRFVVDVEPGISTTEAELTRFLMRVYCDAKGWTRTGKVSFTTAPRRAKGVTLIRLAGREGVKKHCGRLLGDPSQASGNYSCASYAYNEIVLNNVRWEQGSDEFMASGGTLTRYRTMVATHEMGHVLDLRHQLCRTEGGPAPVMMQQSISMTSESTGKTCKPNEWPLRHEIDRLKRRWS